MLPAIEIVCMVVAGDALQLDYSFPELSHQEPQEAADMLLQGYAAAWLGLIPAPATTKSAHAGDSHRLPQHATPSNRSTTRRLITCHCRKLQELSRPATLLLLSLLQLVHSCV